MDTIKDKNSLDLTEAEEINKRWQDKKRKLQANITDEHRCKNP